MCQNLVGGTGLALGFWAQQICFRKVSFVLLKSSSLGRLCMSFSPVNCTLLSAMTRAPVRQVTQVCHLDTHQYII